MCEQKDKSMMNESRMDGNSNNKKKKDSTSQTTMIGNLTSNLPTYYWIGNEKKQNTIDLFCLLVNVDKLLLLPKEHEKNEK